MELRAIYSDMEQAASDVPFNKNMKIIFRHSIRSAIIDAKRQHEAMLTGEGEQLARSFGANIKEKLGFVASSPSPRCIQTVKEILRGNNCDKEIAICDVALINPQTKDKKLAGELFLSRKAIDIIEGLANNKDMGGLWSLKHAVKVMIDYLFSTGGDEGAVDLYCTHDFQMALLYAYFFDYAKTKESIINNKWPMMMEGAVLYGERDNFFIAWRGDTKNVTNLFA